VARLTEFHHQQSLIIMWGSKPLKTMSTVGQLVYTLQRLYTLPTTRVKVLNFEPNHAMSAKHHTTLPRCECISMIQSLYKGMQKTNNPHSYRLGWTITLSSGQHLSKGCCPKRIGLYPCDSDPSLLLSDKVICSITHLINWLSQSHMDCGCTILLGGSLCSD
jgi:hypothetical protein